MDEEDLVPLHQSKKPRDLLPLGDAELEAYVEALQAEIARAQAEIVTKRKRRGGADALFKR